jgi:manganese/iron transport system permease protein
VSWVARTFGSDLAALEVLIAGVVSGVVGVHIVLRRLAFLTMGLTHASFPGLVLAGLLGINLVAGTAGFALVVVAAIVLLGAADRVETSTAIGVALSASFALGVVLVSASDGFTRDLTAYLVGSIATVSPTDVAVTAATGVVVLLAVGLLHKELVLGAFDPASLAALGYPTLVLDLVLMGAVALTVVTALPAMGTILAVSLLVAPAAAARLWTDHVGPAMALAAAFGAGSGLVGLAVSTRFDTAAGATVALVAAAVLAVSAVASPDHGAIATWRSTRIDPTPAPTPATTTGN